MSDTATKPARRSRVQIVKDEAAITQIAQIVMRTSRYDMKDIQAGLDQIADALIAAGRM